MELCIQASRQDQVFRAWVCVNEVGKVGSFVLFVLSTKWVIDAPCFARLAAMHSPPTNLPVTLVRSAQLRQIVQMIN